MKDIDKVADAPRHIVNAWKLIPNDEQKDLRLMADVATQVIVDLIAGRGNENEFAVADESLGQ